MTQAPVFTRWLDDALASYYRWHPVNATFIGVHRHDHALPDLSEQGLATVASEARSLLRRLETLPQEPLSPAEQMDRRLAAGMLSIEEWEQTGEQMWRGNPSLAIGEAVFGVMSLFLREYAPLADRVEAAVERLNAMPTMLEQARATIQTAPSAWTERAIRECDGTLAFLGEGIDLLVAECGIDNPALRAAAGRAIDSVTRFWAFLNDDLQARPRKPVGCGGEALELLVRNGHQIDHDLTRIEAFAWGTLRETEERLTELASEIGVPSWREGLAGLADTHPSADSYEQRYTDIWETARRVAIEQDLLTWPEYPIRYVPRYPWTRSAAPYLYFLFYRAPAAFDRVPIVDYLIAPLDRAATPEEQKRFLRANNDSVIKQNHVVHHGGIGHHVQNWHAYRAESRIGRIAAVDCASRTAMLCGGTMAEGWACYATELMDATGFYTPLERLALAHTRLRMAARAIVDIRLHTGQMTLEEGTWFYADRTAMSPEAARSEAIKNSMFPGAALMYLIGTDLIWQLRRDREKAEGTDFKLRRFHDRFLSYGSVPVSLIAEAMNAESG